MIYIKINVNLFFYMVGIVLICWEISLIGLNY